MPFEPVTLQIATSAGVYVEEAWKPSIEFACRAAPAQDAGEVEALQVLGRANAESYF